MWDTVKKKELSTEQLMHLANEACQWWNAIFVQGRRFLDAFENNHGAHPWEEGGEDLIFWSERQFFIIAIHNAVEYLIKMDIEVQRNGDKSIERILDEIRKVVSLEDIKNLRDMNEHRLDYMAGLGRREGYHSVAEKNGCKISTGAEYTILIGSVPAFLIGNVEIKDLLEKLHSLSPSVRERLGEIFTKAAIDSQADMEN